MTGKRPIIVNVPGSTVTTVIGTDVTSQAVLHYLPYYCQQVTSWYYSSFASLIIQLELCYLSRARVVNN